MKKINIIFIFAILTFPVANGQFTKIGGGLGFTTGYPFHEQTFEENKSGKIDVSVKAIYELSLPFHISPSFTFFLPHVTKLGDAFSTSTYTVSTEMFDINGHYVFNSLDRFEFYGLAGLDILLTGKKDVFKVVGNGVSETSREHDNAIGLNLGLGTYMKMTEQLDLYIEAKYIVSKYDQFMLNAGVLINLDWLKKNENPGI